MEFKIYTAEVGPCSCKISTLHSDILTIVEARDPTLVLRHTNYIAHS